MSVREKFDGAVKWVHTEFQKSMDRFSEDLRSMRIIWIWLLMFLFFWVVIWLVLFYAERCGSTVVMTLGGMVTIIINGYLLSKGHEKHLTHKMKLAEMANGHGKIKPVAGGKEDADISGSD